MWISFGGQVNKANLKFADLPEANLKEANLIGANLKEATGLEAASLEGVWWDEQTQWPEGFSPPPRGVR